MADIKSVKNSTQGASDEYVEQIRQKIGTDFSDRKAAGKKKNELGKDDFIKLMSAQLKHQDPISPLKNEEMAAQLAQFASLEQMTNMNQNIEKLAAAQKPSDNVLAASLIGKRVGTDSSRFLMSQGSQPELKFDLPQDTSQVSVSVVDGKGEVIREIELGAMSKGQQAIRWDGKNSKGQVQNAGEFSFKVTANDTNGASVSVQTATSGLVSGVSFEGGKAMLLVDGKKVPLEAIGRIEADTGPAAAPAAQSNANANGAAKSLAPNATNGAAPASTQQVKKVLPNEPDAETIKTMLSALGATPRMGAESTAGNSGNEDSIPMPLWNPANL